MHNAPTREMYTAECSPYICVFSRNDRKGHYTNVAVPDKTGASLARHTIV